MSHQEAYKLHTAEFSELNRKLDRRNFLSKTASGLGALAMGSLLSKEAMGNNVEKYIMQNLSNIAPTSGVFVYEWWPFSI